MLLQQGKEETMSCALFLRDGFDMNDVMNVYAVGIRERKPKRDPTPRELKFMCMTFMGCVSGSSNVYRGGGQSRQVAEDVAGADGQLAAWLLLKVFLPIYKKVRRRL